MSQVEKGFQAVMDENDIEIVGSMHADGWKAELAYDYINEHPELLDDLDAIMCGNDGIATSTVRALAENGWQARSGSSDRMRSWKHASVLWKERRL